MSDCKTFIHHVSYPITKNEKVCFSSFLLRLIIICILSHSLLYFNYNCSPTEINLNSCLNSGTFRQGWI